MDGLSDKTYTNGTLECYTRVIGFGCYVRLRFFEHVTIDDHFGVIIGSIFHQTWMYDTCYDTDALDVLGC